MNEEKKSDGSFTYKTCPLFPGPEYRSVFMQEVFELTYHGGGGFSYSEVWNMDITKRKYNLKKINEYLEKVREMQEERNQVITEKTDVKKTIIPKFLKDTANTPTYSSIVKK
jgi:hypothetical protein